MSETGWHRHDNGVMHSDDADCTWLGNPVPVPPPDSWARAHFLKNPGHRTREGLDDPGSCRDCRERSPIYDLRERP